MPQNNKSTLTEGCSC